MRSYSHLPLGAALAALSVAWVTLSACGGDVSTGGSGSASNGSTATSGGTGGAGAGGGGSSSSGAGGQGQVCGGFAGLTCADDQWCDYPDDLCGGDDGTGFCTPRPTGACPPDCPGVCGCDGNFYCSACEAASKGVDIGALVSCAGPGNGEYSAEAFFGGFDNLLIRKADPARNVCVMMHIQHPQQNSPGFTVSLPPEYGVVSAQITDQASDCDSVMQPVGKVVAADGGAGSVAWTLPPGKFFPCEVDVHVKLSFPAGEPWVNPTETLDADALVVKNGCQ